MSFVTSFREAAPYIHYLQGKTVVVAISSAVLDAKSLASLAADCNVLTALGLKLVLIHGIGIQINSYCEQQGGVSCHKQRRSYNKSLLQQAQQICSTLQWQIQAALSCGLAHSPHRVPRLRVMTGNFITAKPLGVLDGVDMGYAGSVRKIDTIAIEQTLLQGSVVLLSPLGASATGQYYRLSLGETAQALAIALSAEKLIFVIEQEGIYVSGKMRTQLNAYEVKDLLNTEHVLPEQKGILHVALNAVEAGVPRVQILSGKRNGALLQELFTRDGVGTSIAQAPFMHIRPAQESDITDLLAMTHPLQEKGILMPRDYDYFAEHIHTFFVLENDCQLYGCVALKSYDDAPTIGELACLVIAPHIQAGGYGEQLLAHVIKVAQEQGKTQLLALSTQTTDWFIERGFVEVDFSILPIERQKEYLHQKRQSRIFSLNL